MKIERQALAKFAGQNLQAPLRLDATLSELYHENTKLGPLSSKAYGQWIGQIGRSSTMVKLMRQPYKVYSLMDQVELPAPQAGSGVERAIAERRSQRMFTGESMSREELSRLLFFTYGRTEGEGYFRAVPSGGALYPLEIYVAALRVDDLEPGIYHYAPEHHLLDVIERRPRLAELEHAIWFDPIQVDEAAAIVIISAIFQRTTLKYQDRGYRMVLLEAGAAAQNLLLVSTALGLGGCLVGGFHDDTVSAILGLDGSDEAPLVPVALGRPRGTDGSAPSAGDW